MTTTAPLVTPFDAARDLARLNARRAAVAGPASIAREALRRARRELATIDGAVDEEADGAEELLAHRPRVLAEVRRLEDVVARHAREEREVAEGLASYGLTY